MNITYKVVSNNKLLDQVFTLRMEVFVDEQKVPPEIELDDLDKSAIHIVAIKDDVAIGCGRIVMTSEHAHIGRVAVKKCYRNMGVGKQLMFTMINIAKEQGTKEIILHAQIQVVPFYESLGFISHGNTFMDAGIEHIEMSLRV